MEARGDDPYLQRDIDAGADMKIVLPFAPRFESESTLAQWAPRLSSFVRETVSAFEQIQARVEVAEIPFLGGSTGVEIQTSFQTEPAAVLITQCRNRDAATVEPTPVSCSWIFEGGAVRLVSVPSLAAGVSFDLRICIFGSD